GSLVKPFVAFACRGGASVIDCHGESGRCWKPGGHGRLDLPMAIAYSCNAYFLALARSVDVAALERLYLPAPLDLSLETLIGLGDRWPLAPLELMRAYRELLALPSRDILRGMRLSAKLGTAREIRCDAYAKTGTAPCRHEKRSPGDGYAIA